MNMHSELQQKNDLLSKVRRPEDHIEKLVQMACKNRTPVTIANKRSICLIQNGEHHCLILLSGSVALYRITDGMVLNTECAPFIFGANTQLAYTLHLHIRAKETTRFLLIPQRIFYDEIKQHNLWYSLAYLQDYTAAKVYAHCLTASQLSAYEIIRCYLIELMGEPETLRLNITAANYIRDHSYLSRSGIMRILSQLKKSGYIHLSRGILTQIIHLPEKLNMFYAKTPSVCQLSPGESTSSQHPVQRVNT